MGILEDIRIEKLERLLFSYRAQSEAAMRAPSLGLCKRIIKHAMEDDNKRVKTSECAECYRNGDRHDQASEI